MSKTSFVKLSILPKLTRKSLHKVRFRQVAAVQKTETGTGVTFADGRKARVNKRSPLATLSVHDFKALSNSLPQLLEGALQAASPNALVTQGSFSTQFTDYVISANPALQGLIAAGCEIPRLHESFTRWLETLRFDYIVEMSIESLLDIGDAAFDDLRLFLDLQLNGVTNGPMLVMADYDNDGKEEAYWIDHHGDIYDSKWNRVGNTKDEEDEEEKKGWVETFWDWWNDKDDIMWGKEFPLRLQTFVIAQFLDMNSTALRALVTDVAAGRLTVEGLEVQANALVDLEVLKAAILQSSAAPAIKRALGPDLSALQAMRISAVMVS